MRLSYQLFIASLISGIILCGIGGVMMYYGHSSTGVTSYRDGSMHEGTINGQGAIFLGIVILGYAVFAYFEYRSIKKELESMD